MQLLEVFGVLGEKNKSLALRVPKMNIVGFSTESHIGRDYDLMPCGEKLSREFPRIRAVIEVDSLAQERIPSRPGNGVPRLLPSE